MTLARIRTDSLSKPLDWFLSGLDDYPKGRSAWTPLVDVIENEEAYEVIAEIPGMNKEDIHLAVEDNVLTISGEKTSHSAENATCHRHERSSGKFERSFRLPKEVNAKDIKAAYTSGVLTVTLPKAAEAKPKQISIQ